MNSETELDEVEKSNNSRKDKRNVIEFLNNFLNLENKNENLSPKTKCLVIGFLTILPIDIFLSKILRFAIKTLNIPLDKIGDLYLNIFVDIAFLIIIGILFWRYILDCIKDYKKRGIEYNFNYFVNSFIFVAALNIISTIISFLVYGFGVPKIENNEAINGMLHINMVPTLVLVVITGPIVEEFIFRVIFCGTIAKKSKILGVAISSIVFGAMHMILSVGYKSFSDILLLSIVYVLMGVGFGVIYVKTNNVLYNLSIHMVINIIASINMLLFR